ncbi:FG-GAP repeat protein [Candidatus Fermentibacteria bacterium]|nr:FG-GAP repeat protein [Candidatus Fermentibacteria bacterium]
MQASRSYLAVLITLILVGAAHAVEQKLDPSDGAANDRFGWSVATNGDYAIIGAPQDQVNGNNNQGSAYIYYRGSGTWTQQAKLTASDGEPGVLFGHSVAICGDYAIVGAPQEWSTGTGAGAAYIFKRSGTTWSQQAKLIPTDSWKAYDEFGTSVSISSVAGVDYALIGAPYDDEHGEDSGSAYVFRRTTGTTWVQEAELSNAYPAEGDHFGYSVAISGLGSVAIVGAPGDRIGSNEDQGSARVFLLSGSSWNPSGALQASDGTSSDEFGRAVAVSAIGSHVIVGAPRDDDGGGSSGTAFVYYYSAGSWSQQAKLTAPDAAAWDLFGWSVSMDGLGTHVIVGAHGEDANGDGSGAIYSFSRDGSTWSSHAKRTPNDGAAGDCFGMSVSIATRILAGAPQDNPNGTYSGSAYAYEWDDLPGLPAMELHLELLSPSSARLWWNSIPGATAYHLHRNTVPYFHAGAATPWMVVLAPATQYTFGTGIGDPSVNYYYRGVAGAAGQVSPESNIVGETDFGGNIP